jgi:hypothetical protein
MKMKKTQSLKLMLLGLFALVSGSAWAAVGDVFVDQGGLIYQELDNGKAKLIAIGSIGSSKVITIPTDVYNQLDQSINDAPKELKVTQVADDWYAPGKEIWIVQNGTPLYKATLKSALDYEGLTLKIDAEELLTISTKAIQPLNRNIAKFVVTADAGLTAIPDYAFFRADVIPSIPDEEVAKTIAALQRQKALLDLKIDGKDAVNTKLTDGTTLYYLTVLDQTAVLDPLTLVIKSEPDANGFYDLIDVTTGQPTGVKAMDWPGTANLADPESHKVVAAPYWSEIKGLQDEYDDLQTTINGLNGQIGTLAGSNEYNTALNVLRTAQENADKAQAMLNLYNTVSSLWYAADEAVVDQIQLHGRYLKGTGDYNAMIVGWTEGQIKAYNDLWDALPNAKVTYKGKEYRYSTIPNTGGYNRPNSDALQSEILTANANLETAKAAAPLTNMANLEDQLAQAQAQQDAILPYLNYYKNEREGIANQIKNLQDNELMVPQYQAATDMFGTILFNDVLVDVDLLGTKLAAVGISAFENCVAANFTTAPARIPVNVKNIAKRAFYNASIAPIFGQATQLETIGDEAFANSNAVTANFTNSPNLFYVGEHVFDNCKLTNLLLAGTAIEANPNGPKYPNFLAQCLYLETPKFVDDCGYFYNYDVTKPEDVAALKALGFDDEDIAAKNGGVQKVNTTLKKVSLPENIKAIPNTAFMNDINLNNLAGGIPAGVKSIGYQAFYRTKITEFDLTNCVDLETIGSQAFAGNSDLTKVILPQDKKDATGVVIAEAKLTTLGDGVFECDGDLKDVILSPDITCLPAGTFAGNNTIEELDLSNTKIEVLYNLFGTSAVAKINDYDQPYKEELANTTLKKIILPKQVLDPKDNYTELIPGLKIIMPNALAYMVGLGTADKDGKKWGVEIPSTVEFMGDGVFFNCVNLETVTAMDSKLRTFGFNTFRNCRNLKEFTFVTLKMARPFGSYVVDPTAMDITNLCGLENVRNLTVHSFATDQNFFANNGSGTTKVIVTEETADILDRYFPKVNHGYAYLEIYQPELTLPSGDNQLFADGYSNEYYATWIPMEEADVYTAYQDMNKIYMFKGKHNQGYYKIPAAYNNPAAITSPAPARMAAPTNDNYTTEEEYYNEVFKAWLRSTARYTAFADMTYAQFLGSTTAKEEGLYDKFFEDYIAYQKSLVMDFTEELMKTIFQHFTPGNNVYTFPQQAYAGTYIDWYIDGKNNQEGLSAAVIIIDKKINGADADGKVKYERHSDPALINQSTIDPCNQLRTVRTPIDFGKSQVSSNLYMWGYETGKASSFYRIGSGIVKAGKTVLPLTRINGSVGTEYDFDARDIEIIWVNDETTAVEYLKANESLKSDNAIYNLKGVRVTTPIKGQMYIQNGRKFIQK